MKNCYNCGCSVGDTYLMCPMCGCTLQSQQVFISDIHTASDFPRNYGNRHLVLGMNYLLRIIVSFVLGNIIGGIAYLMYRKRYNQSIGYFRMNKFDMSYAYRTKMHIYLAVFIVSIPINYVTYILWSIKSLLGMV